MRACLFLLFGLACSSQPAATQPVVQALPAPEAAAIRRQRGDLLRDGGTLAFRPCGEEGLAAIQGVALPELEEVFGKLAGDDASAVVPVELVGALRETGDGSRLLDSAALQVALPPGSTWLCERDASYAFRASGAEPFWSASITEQRLGFQTPAMAAPLDLPAVPTRRSGGVLEFTAELDGHLVDLSLRPERCWDGASGAAYALQANALVDGRSYRGCGHEGWPASAR